MSIKCLMSKFKALLLTRKVELNKVEPDRVVW